MRKKLLKDKPIENKSEDILGHYSFAEQIVNVLKLLPEDDSFNFALCGDWGSGKTSILNLTKEIVEKENIYKVIQFNPWNITKKKNIVFEFLELLKKTIYEESSNKKIISSITKYSKVLYANFATDRILSKFIGFLLEILSLRQVTENNTVSEYKSLLISYLQNKYEGRPILVIIDDLDRLTNKETCRVLQLIREVADFPHIVYLVAFDKPQVINAIKIELEPKDPSEYLKKFFQLEWNLPKHSNYELKKYIISKITQYKELNDYFSESEKDYFLYLYEQWISKSINNIRDVILAFNSFYQKFFILKNYVNIIDLFSITLIELYYPELYSYIRQNKSLLLFGSGIPGTSLIERSVTQQTETDYSEKVKDYIDKSLQQFNIKNKHLALAKHILFILFPTFSNTCKESIDHIDYQKSTLEKRLLCSAVCFDAFFSQNIQDIATIAPGEVESVLLTENINYIIDFLTKYLKNLNIFKNITVEISQILTKDIKNENVMYTIFCAFCIFGQNARGFIEDDSLFPQSIRRNIYELVCQIFNNLERKTIYKFVNKFLFEEKHLMESYKFILYFIQMIGHNYSSRIDPEPDYLYFSYEFFDELIKHINTELNKNHLEIELFDESLEDIVFTYYLKYAHESLEEYYSSQLQKTENIIELCILAYPHVIQSNYESIENMFDSVYQLNSLKGKGKLIAEYINNGQYMKLSEKNKSRFAKVVDKLKLISYQNKETLNTEYWKIIKQLSENDIL